LGGNFLHILGALRRGNAKPRSDQEGTLRSNGLRRFAPAAVELRHGDAGIMRQQILAHVLTSALLRLGRFIIPDDFA
jgi:hypothetical protein